MVGPINESEAEYGWCFQEKQWGNLTKRHLLSSGSTPICPCDHVALTFFSVCQMPGRQKTQLESPKKKKKKAED